MIIKSNEWFSLFGYSEQFGARRKSSQCVSHYGGPQCKWSITFLPDCMALQVRRRQCLPPQRVLVLVCLFNRVSWLIRSCQIFCFYYNWVFFVFFSLKTTENKLDMKRECECDNVCCVCRDVPTLKKTPIWHNALFSSLSRFLSKRLMSLEKQKKIARFPVECRQVKSVKI